MMLFGATAIRSMVGDPRRHRHHRFHFPKVHISRARFKGLGRILRSGLRIGSSFIPGIGGVAAGLLGGASVSHAEAEGPVIIPPEQEELDTDTDDFDEEDQGDPGFKGSHRRAHRNRKGGHKAGGRFHVGKIAEEFAGGIPGVGGGIKELLHEGMHGGGGPGGHRRRINWANPRALGRAERRLGSFIHHFTRTARFLGMHVSRAPSRRRKGAFPRRRK